MARQRATRHSQKGTPLGPCGAGCGAMVWAHQPSDVHIDDTGHAYVVHRMCIIQPMKEDT